MKLILASAAVLFAILSRMRNGDIVIDEADSEYDFIVVGGGTTGCVIANRLSEDDGVRVLLLEAGDSDLKYPQIFVPSQRDSMQKTPVDWNYTIESQTHSQASFPNQAAPYLRGKVLGGTSSLNYMNYVRGSPHDYDSWEKNGAENWSYAGVLKYFQRAEKVIGRGGPESFGRDGFLTLTTRENIIETPFASFMAKVFKELEVPFVTHADDIETAGFTMKTMDRGLRKSSAAAYLRSVFPERKNRLHVLTRATATKILINSKGKAYGVQYRRNGKEYIARAKREIVISAGVFGTPHLLLLSGIGPKEHLNKFNISVVSDLPGVGSNLQDHVFVFTTLTTNTSFSDHRQDDITQETDYIVNAKGDIAYDNWIIWARNNSVYDMPAIDRQELYPRIAEFGTWVAHPDNTVTLTIMSILSHGKSRGKLELKSGDPMAHPSIDPKYYSNEEDIKLHIEGIKATERIKDTDAMRRVGGDVQRHEACIEEEPGSEEYYICVIRHSAKLMSHACCTARMGPSSDRFAVVDPKLQVYGVKNLRVADTSIMPHITTGNTQAPCYMIGEKAADEIRKKWRN